MKTSSYQRVSLVVFCITFIVGCNGTPAKHTPSLNSPIELGATVTSTSREYSKEVVAFHNLFSQTHYKRSKQRNISSLAYSLFLDKLDANKSILLKDDEEALRVEWQRVYDRSLTGDLVPLANLSKKYNEIVSARLDWILKKIDAGKFDNQFNRQKQHQIISHRFSASKELNEYWEGELYNSYRQGIEDSYSKEAVLAGLKQSYSKRLQQLEQEQIIKYFLDSIAKGHDPDSAYFLSNPKKPTNMSLSLEGVGLVLKRQQNKTIVVRALKGGPSEKILSSGDTIIAINNENRGYISVFGWALDDVINLIRGPSGTYIKMRIKTATQKIKDVELKRERTNLSSQEAQLTYYSVMNKGAENKVAVISIPNFYFDFSAYQRKEKNHKSVSRDISRLLQSLDRETKVVLLDLRDNGGGVFIEAFNLLDLLFDKKRPYLLINDGKNKPTVIQSKKSHQLSYGGRLAVLVNESSAGSAEIVAAAIQDHGRGIVIGRPTYGLGVIGSLRPLLYGQVKVTASEYFRITGKPVHLDGVMPDIPLKTVKNKTPKTQKDRENNMLPSRAIGALIYKGNNLSQDIAKLTAHKQADSQISPQINDLMLEHALSILSHW